MTLLPSDFSLSQNAALRYLDMRVPCSYLPEILAQVTSRQLEGVTLHLAQYDVPHMDWARVDSILCQSRWSTTLRTVQIKLDAMREHHGELLKAALPTIADRGLLSVSLRTAATAAVMEYFIREFPLHRTSA